MTHVTCRLTAKNRDQLQNQLGNRVWATFLHHVHLRCAVDRIGNYLVVLFLISKVFYIGNVVAQLFLLNVVLATKYQTFGYEVLRDLIANRDWTEESYVAFPRVTLCDFKVRGQDMVNVHAYTVQCVLPINLYNESIYVFLWYWMVLVAALSVLRFASTLNSR